MSYVRVADQRDIPAEGMTAVTAADRELVLVGHAGQIYALDRRCTHMGGDLAAGTLSGGILTCPRHGSQFDVATGRCVQGPHIVFVKIKGRDTRSYAVRLEDDQVLVDVD